MKITEIIAEAKSTFRKGAKKAIPGLKSFPDLDNGNVPYLQYRFGLLLAGAPDMEIDTHGPTGGQLLTISYSDADEEIIQAASKAMGIIPTTQSERRSIELDSINKQSPLASKKKNKYGV